MGMEPSTDAASYPLTLDVDHAYEDRNRLTTLFRIILAIPHLILVGGPGFLAMGTFRWRRNEFEGSAMDGPDGGYTSGLSNGLIGVVAFVTAVFSWFAILFTGRHPKGLWDISHYYMRWRVRANAYTALFRDEYPPFGDQPYPAVFDVGYPDAPRRRWTVFFRLFMVLPQVFVLLFVNIAWFFTSVFGWLSILFTGRYPVGAYEFGLRVFRWNTRVEVYALLMRDEYPPFHGRP